MTNALHTANILLPNPKIDLTKWSVVACDQFTAQPEYWHAVERIVGNAPSALRLVLPEAWLAQSDARIPGIREAMNRYLTDGTLITAVKDGFALVERTTAAGVRPGLMVALDLDEYDYDTGRPGLIRATEGTVLERVPPRARVRAGAPVELPHVMMLIDDPDDTVIGPLMAKRDALRGLYDFELMQNGGHLRGWAVEGACSTLSTRSTERPMGCCTPWATAITPWPRPSSAGGASPRRSPRSSARTTLPAMPWWSW